MTFVSQSTVWEAANTLRRQGIPPSVRKIREELGGGSLSDIQAELKRWRAQYVTTDEDTGRDPILSLVNDLYDALTQRVSQEMTQREKALTAKVDAYESHKAAIDLALHQQEQEIRDLKAALATREAVESRLTSERDEARANVVALTSERDHLKKALAQREADHAEATATLQATHQRELDQSLRAQTQIKRDLADSQQARSALSDQIAALKEQVRGLEERSHREAKVHQGTVKTMQAELGAAHNNLKQLEADNADLRSENTALTAEIKRWRGELAQAHEALKAEQSALARLRDELTKQTDALQSKVAANEDRANAFERQVIRLETERDTMKSLLDRLKVQGG